MTPEAVWKRFEAPFGEDLSRAPKDTRQHIRLALRCIGLFKVFNGGDRDDVDVHGLGLIYELCADEAPLKEAYRNALVQLRESCARIKPWLGRAENIETAKMVDEVAFTAQWVLAATGPNPSRAPLRNDKASPDYEEILVERLNLALRSFQPEFQLLLVQDLAHLPRVLGRACVGKSLLKRDFVP